MRIRFVLATVLFVCWSSAPNTSNAEVADDALRIFAQTLANYYGIPQREVVVVHERGIPDDELPVVFMIAREARVPAIDVVNLRLSGRHWDDILRSYHISPEVLYVEAPVENFGPPYGRAYGYYRNHPRNEWNKIVFEDDDVVNLVNLGVLSKHRGLPPRVIIDRRSAGNSFVAIDREFAVHREQHNDHDQGHAKNHKGKGHKGKSHKQH